MALTATLGLAGCQTTSGTNPPSKPAPSASRVLPKAGELPTPPGVDRRQLVPREEAALQRATESFEQIAQSLESTPLRQMLAQIRPAVEAQPQQDVPLQAQLAYVQGKTALMQGQVQQGITLLRQAMGMAPQDPGIARLLAWAWLSVGNRNAAAACLEQAVRNDPDDIDSLFKLGRLHLDRGQWREALTYFLHAQGIVGALEQPSPALERISQYYIGGALEAGGHDQAAMEKYLAALAGPLPDNDLHGPTHHLMMLMRQSGIIWQAIGDMHLRLDQPGQALEAYQQAVSRGVPQLGSWVARYAYTQLLLGHPEQATDRMLEFLRSGKPDEAAMALVRYVIDHGGDAGKLAQTLKGIYDTQPSVPLALTLGCLLPHEESQAFLKGHLKTSPADRPVFEQLIRQELAWQSPDPKAGDGVTRAMRLTAELIQLTPTAAEEYTAMLLTAARGDKPLAQAYEKMPAARQTSPALRYIVAAEQLASGHSEQAITGLQRIVRDDPSFIPASIQLAGQYIASRQWAHADALLTDIPAAWAAQADRLRILLLAEQGRYDQALEKVDQLIAQDPTNLSWPMFKASIQMDMRADEQAERTLLTLLEANPRHEPVYAALLRLYDQGRLPDISQRYQKLMSRLFEALPQSRLARFQYAVLQRSRQENAQAERVLRELLAENPRDFEVLGQLLSLLRDTNRAPQADAMVESLVERWPEDPQVLGFAADYFGVYKNLNRAFELRHRQLLTVGDPQQRATSLAQLYLQAGRLDEALAQARIAWDGQPKAPVQATMLLATILHRMERSQESLEVIDQSVKRFPAHEVDLLFERAMLIQRMGQEEQSLQALLSLLKRYPDHALANNALGYAWADKGIHLEEARRMIQVAVDAEPDNASYLDSLGWVYYKLGQYEQAVRWLKLAVDRQGGQNPLILDHLGDACYQAGESTQAIAYWRQAQKLLETRDYSHDPEVARLPEHLRVKLAAAAANQIVPVADSLKPATTSPAP